MELQLSSHAADPYFVLEVCAHVGDSVLTRVFIAAAAKHVYFHPDLPS